MSQDLVEKSYFGWWYLSIVSRGHLMMKNWGATVVLPSGIHIDVRRGEEVWERERDLLFIV